MDDDDFDMRHSSGGGADGADSMMSSAICSLLFSLYMVFVFYRFTRRQHLDLLTPKIVLRGLDFGRSTMDLLRLHGQRGGFVGWLMEAMNLPQAYELHVSEKLATIKRQGARLEYHYVIPVNQITAVYCDHYIPLTLMIHGAGIGAGLGIKGGFGILIAGACFGLLLAYLASTTCIHLSAGHRGYGFRFSIGHNVPKEQVFAAFEELRRLLVRIQLGLLPATDEPQPASVPLPWGNGAQALPPGAPPGANGIGAGGTAPPPWQGATATPAPPSAPAVAGASETLHGFAAQK